VAILPRLALPVVPLPVTERVALALPFRRLLFRGQIGEFMKGYNILIQFHFRDSWQARKQRQNSEITAAKQRLSVALMWWRGLA
jgi:hypothetical protein